MKMYKKYVYTDTNSGALGKKNLGKNTQYTIRFKSTIISVVYKSQLVCIYLYEPNLYKYIPK